MLDKIKALFAVFHTGEMVADPKAWKLGQIGAGALAAFLIALVSAARVFGYDLHISDDDLLKVAGGVVALLSVFQPIATVVSTDKLGLRPRADGKSDAIVQLDGSALDRSTSQVDSPGIPPMREFHAQHPSALQPERQPAPAAPKSEPVNSSFTNGS